MDSSAVHVFGNDKVYQITVSTDSGLLIAYSNNLPIADLERDSVCSKLQTAINEEDLKIPGWTVLHYTNLTSIKNVIAVLRKSEIYLECSSTFKQFEENPQSFYRHSFKLNNNAAAHELFIALSKLSKFTSMFERATGMITILSYDDGYILRSLIEVLIFNKYEITSWEKTIVVNSE